MVVATTSPGPLNDDPALTTTLPVVAVPVFGPVPVKVTVPVHAAAGAVTVNDPLPAEAENAPAVPVPEQGAFHA